MSHPSSPYAKQSLFPKDWHIAPWIYCKQQTTAASIFIAVNLIFGTVGLWLPLLNGWFRGGDLSEETNNLLRTGGLYFYVVAFLAATFGTVFASIISDGAEHSRSTKTLLLVIALIAFFGCSILMEAQLFNSKPEVELRNLRVEAVVSLLTFLASIYIHAIIQNETNSSALDDMKENAKELQAQSIKAAITAKDFE